jgi:hypothetical protein
MDQTFPACRFARPKLSGHHRLPDGAFERRHLPGVSKTMTLVVSRVNASRRKNIATPN